MTELQRQLRHLISFYAVPGTDVDKAVSEIEEAVGIKQLRKLMQQMADMHVQLKEQVTRLSLSSKPIDTYKIISPDSQTELISGQEWYNRLQDELKGVVFPHGETNVYVVNAVDVMTKAAKRAAGLAPVEGEDKANA